MVLCSDKVNYDIYYVKTEAKRVSESLNTADRLLLTYFIILSGNWGLSFSALSVY
jgi:hypothetical protein